ncbi:MAG TPA: amidohydrolase family protein, partial [Povalibacter sp.]|nr:amidohydrolase family protein [Povalibacter sp.]
MLRSWSLTFLASTVCVLGPIAAAETLIVHDARVYTPAGNEIHAYAGMVIENGRIQRMLSQGEKPPTIAGARTLDAGGKTILPGLIYAHGHVLGLGQERLQPDLRGSASIAEAQERLRKFAAANPAAARSAWVVGRGWNQVLWPDKQFPTAKDLDAVVADRPAVLSRVDGHAAWVNTRA